MTTKVEELTKTGSCLDKAKPNEPLFILRGQDRFASEVIRYWAHLVAGGCIVSYEIKLAKEQPKKIQDALLLADEMDRWPVRKHPD